MTHHPDLSTLPQRMRYAATVLEEVNARIVAAGYAAQYRAWHHDGLRTRADIWESEDRSKAAIDALVETLTAELAPHFAGWMGDMSPIFCQTAATRMIKSGWRKGDPE